MTRGVRPIPDALLAGELAERAIGLRPVAITRFATGLQHYVFEVAFEARPPVVVRLNVSAERAIMANALRLNQMLRPLGVPLPAILGGDVEHAYPHLILERLPGTDLGEVIGTLPDAALDTIAKRVADLQDLAAGTPSAGRYGFAADPAKAPHARWSGVIRDSLRRSSNRIAAAGLFEPTLADRLERLVGKNIEALERIPATPFLHDTTTKNVIVMPDGTFSGIVDVDDLCFGDPRFAPALTQASLMVSGGPTRYVASWLARAGQPDDALFRLYVALFLLDFMSEHGQVFNGNQRPSSPEARARLRELFLDLT